jgi:hypothetical protein
MKEWSHILIRSWAGRNLEVNNQLPALAALHPKLNPSAWIEYEAYFASDSVGTEHWIGVFQPGTESQLSGHPTHIFFPITRDGLESVWRASHHIIQWNSYSSPIESQILVQTLLSILWRQFKASHLSCTHKHIRSRYTFRDIK